MIMYIADIHILVVKREVHQRNNAKVLTQKITVKVFTRKITVSYEVHQNMKSNSNSYSPAQLSECHSPSIPRLQSF